MVRPGSGRRERDRRLDRPRADRPGGVHLTSKNPTTRCRTVPARGGSDPPWSTGSDPHMLWSGRFSLDRNRPVRSGDPQRAFRINDFWRRSRSEVGRRNGRYATFARRPRGDGRVLVDERSAETFTPAMPAAIASSWSTRTRTPASPVRPGRCPTSPRPPPIAATWSELDGRTGRGPLGYSEFRCSEAAVTAADCSWFPA